MGCNIAHDDPTLVVCNFLTKTDFTESEHMFTTVKEMPTIMKMCIDKKEKVAYQFNASKCRSVCLPTRNS